MRQIYVGRESQTIAVEIVLLTIESLQEFSLILR